MEDHLRSEIEALERELEQMNKENLEKTKRISDLSQTMSEYKIKAESVSDHEILLVILLEFSYFNPKKL
jgi:prefoldin subunit 5